MKNPWVRLVLATSLDGRIALPNAKKSNLGKQGDRRVLEKALAWADCTLIGAETIRKHENTCLIHDQELISERIIQGRTKQPVSIIVSKKNDFNQSWEFFNQPINRWLLTPSKNKYSQNYYQGFERVIPMKNNWTKTLHQIGKLGFLKIVLLGGAKLALSLLSEDKVDELQLTFIPRLIGGNKTWVPLEARSLHLQNNNAWDLKKSQHLGNNELMIKYIRNRSEVNLISDTDSHF